MLVVTRKTGERVLIPGAGISITVVRVLPNGQVRLGVEAPPNVGVYREELLASSKQTPAEKTHDR